MTEIKRNCKQGNKEEKKNNNNNNTHYVYIMQYMKVMLDQTMHAPPTSLTFRGTHT